MFNISHLKGGSLHACVRLPIASLLYDSVCLEFEDPETRIWLTIRKVHPEALCTDRNMLEVFDFIDYKKLKRQQILLDMTEADFEGLCNRHWSEREKETGVCLEIKASAPDKWKWVPATVEYVWPDRQNPEATS